MNTLINKTEQTRGSDSVTGHVTTPARHLIFFFRSFCYSYFENHFLILFLPSKWLYSGVMLCIIAARPQDVYIRSSVTHTCRPSAGKLVIGEVRNETSCRVPSYKLV